MASLAFNSAVLSLDMLLQNAAVAPSPVLNLTTEAVPSLTVSQLSDKFGYDDCLAMLYEQFHQPVFRVGYRFLHSREEAEEVLQQVFMIAWDKMKKHKIDRFPLPWLLTIALNVSRNLRRSLLRKSQNMEKLKELSHLDGIADQNTDPSQNSEMDIDMMKILDGLPEKYLREVLILVELENIPLLEVADVLQLRPGALRMRLSRAHARLRQLLTHPKWGWINQLREKSQNESN